MWCKPEYPEDFKDVLRKTLKARELDELCAKASSPPIFVYGHLMIPTVLKYVAGISQSTKVDMIFANLPGHHLWHFSGNGEPGFPIIKPTFFPSASVEGMLVFGLTWEQRSEILDFEGAQTKETILEHVEVQVLQVLDRTSKLDVKCPRSIDAGTLVWRSRGDGLESMDTSFWPIDDFISSPFFGNVVRYQNSAQKDEDF